ncbi:MAG: hypothetical protein KAS07_04440, partial [Candidatus Pacebacteria bacterium]|nr:hypothetical protein [Candidatus Paceibacterota bacterium]
SVSKEDSVFTLWTKEPSTSNTKGMVELGGGSPASFSGSKTILTIVFEAKKEGLAEVSISEGLVVSPSAGFADILSEKKGAVFTIGVGDIATPVPVVPNIIKPEPLGPAPEAPVLSSSLFKDSDKWYATTTATFEWQLLYDISAVKLLVDDKEISVPSVLYEPAVSSKTLTNLKEGESYFHIMFRNKAGWGVPTHQRLRIDVTKPKPFVVTGNQDDLLTQDVVLRFKVEDELSGIEYYKITIDGGEIEETVLESDLINSEYSVHIIIPGQHTVSVEAYDFAGNSAIAETTFTIKEVIVTNTKIEEEEIVEKGINWEYWFIIILVAITAFLVGAIVYERKAIRSEKDYIKREADEAREKLEGIFSVLRDEIEEQVIVLATKPNMTESERQILEKLKEALEISEELLDKEIEDVRKLLQ